MEWNEKEERIHVWYGGKAEKLKILKDEKMRLNEGEQYGKGDGRGKGS